MTCSSDKLPALSGVAKTLRAVMGGTYLAGVWDNGNLLHHHLAWSTTGPELRPRPAYRAPTWSWASIDHPVKFWHKPGTDCLFHTKLVQAYVDPTGTDDTGAVKGGFLLLQGHLKRISQPYNKEALSEAIKLHLDTCEEIDYGDLFFLSLFTEYFMEETRYGDIDWDNFGRHLILVRHPQYRTGYRRVGFATTAWHDTDDPNHQDEAEVDPGNVFLEEIEVDVACEGYRGPGEREGHLVKIY